MSGIERRNLTRRPVITREADGSKPKISGYGAVYYDAADQGTEYQLWQDTFERFAPGAFDGAVKPEADVRSLFNHDSNFVLGRTTAGTLALSVDKTGLQYTTTPPDTQLVRDAVLSPIERGDVDGASVMFFVRNVAWLQETRDGREVEVREIREVELLEVGPVTFPAYESTSAGVRKAGEIDHEALMQERAQLLRLATKPAAGPSEVDVRLRLLAVARSRV
jgi:uncharacterized protein